MSLHRNAILAAAMFAIPIHLNADTPQQAAESANQRPTLAPFFQNSFLRVTCQSINESKSKKRINLVLQFENISKNDIYLALKSDGKNVKSGLADDAGNILFPSSWNGLPWVFENSFGNPHPRVFKDYTLLTIAAKTTVIYSYDSKEDIEGSVFSFSAEIYRYIIEKSDEKENKGKYEQFSIGLADLKLKPQ